MVDSVLARSAVVVAPDEWAPAVRTAMAAALPAELALRFGAEHLVDATFLLAATTPVTQATVDAAPNLRLVHKWGVGLDTLDLDALGAAGVGVAVTTGANAHAVAEHTIMLALAALRDLPFAHGALREGRWAFPEMRERARQLAGRTAGIVGLGNIGRAVARRLQGFDVDVLYTDPVPADPATERRLGVTRVPLETLLERSDVLTLHCPGGAENRHLIGAEQLAALPAGALLVNTARGDLVDAEALVAALDAGRLRGAALDVFEDEPITATGHRLAARDDVVCTPHSAGSVLDNVERVARHAYGNMLRVLHGEPLPADDLVLAPRG